MPQIIINITEFEQKLMANAHSDIDLYAENLIKDNLKRYGNNLGDRLIRARFDKNDGQPIPASRQMVVEEMFDREDYKTMAEEEAAREAAKSATESPIISDIIR